MDQGQSERETFPGLPLTTRMASSLHWVGPEEELPPRMECGANEETGAASLSAKVKFAKQVSGKLGSVSRSVGFQPTLLTALLRWEGAFLPTVPG